MEHVQYLKENGDIGGSDKDKLNNRENSKYDLYYYGMHATLRILPKEYYARIKNINTDFNIKNCLLVSVGADWTDNTKILLNCFIEHQNKTYMLTTYGQKLF